MYLQDRALQLVLRVMLSFKTSEVDPCVKSLDQQKLDTLMKYIYRGFECPSEGSSAQLLTWHEKVSVNVIHIQCYYGIAVWVRISEFSFSGLATAIVK